MRGVARQVSLDPNDGMELWEAAMRDRMNVYFPPEHAHADRRSCRPQEALAIGDRRGGRRVIPVADGADRREAAFTRRLDRLSRQVQRLERELGVTAETLALFVGSG